MSSLKESLSKIPSLLRGYYGGIDIRDFLINRVLNKSLFEFVIGVVLSQNTSDRNAIVALNNLYRQLDGEINPERILKLDYGKLVEAIKPAGMQEVKAKYIVMLAEFFSDDKKVSSLISEINSGDLEYARLALKRLPGVGDKTSDVILLMYFGKPTFPVDTHIARITKRLGYLDKYDYGSIRRFWMKILDPKTYLETHLLLIKHGRTICRSKKPLCRRCILKTLCRSYEGSPKRASS